MEVITSENIQDIWQHLQDAKKTRKKALEALEAAQESLEAAHSAWAPVEHRISALILASRQIIKDRQWTDAAGKAIIEIADGVLTITPMSVSDVFGSLEKFAEPLKIPLDFLEVGGEELRMRLLARFPPLAPRIRTCNRHKDCDEADRAAGRWNADHCHDDCCEDCFGS